MAARTGLAAEVPTLDLCREMAAIPALAEAFGESAVEWFHAEDVDFLVTRGTRVPIFPPSYRIPAPLVSEMLAWLLAIRRGINRGVADREYAERNGEPLMYIGTDECRADITDPDALARACIAAARGQG